MITVVIPLRVLARISFWREQVMTVYHFVIGRGLLTSFNENNRANFPGVEKSAMKPSRVSIFRRIEIKNLSTISGMICEYKNF